MKCVKTLILKLGLMMQVAYWCKAAVSNHF